jgi:hypothetical protein
MRCREVLGADSMALKGKIPVEDIEGILLRRECDLEFPCD